MSRIFDSLFSWLFLFTAFMWGLYLFNPFFSFVPFHVDTAPIALTFWLIVYIVAKRHFRRKRWMK